MGWAFLHIAAMAAAGIAGSSSVALAGDGAELPRPGVVVFWASWCVPCRAELKRVAELAVAARPLPIALLALDSPDVARAALRRMNVTTARAFADPRPPAQVLAAWGATALPLAVAIDRAGKVCGVKRGLLGTDQLRRWATTCSR